MIINQKIIQSINKSRTGSIFFASSFPMFDIEYVGRILAALAKEGLLVRIGQGAYLKPVKSSFGIVYPPTDEIVKAIAKRDNAQVMETGNTALNKLGLSPQVPMNAEYLTSGTARKLSIGNRTITLKHGSPKNFAYKGTLAPLLIQAMKALGQENIDEETISGIREILIKNSDIHFEKDILSSPVWIKKILQKILKENYFPKRPEARRESMTEASTTTLRPLR